jgi:glycosyltransferase involved in cell wall biosynthesis
MTQAPPKVLIVIPAFNEEQSIGAAVRKVRRVCPDYGLVIINDGSTDNTRVVAGAQGADTVNLADNLGIGGAVQTGFLLARRRKYNVMIQYDGDNQHPAEQVGQLADTLRKSGADIVIGSRFIAPGGYKTFPFRLPGIFILSRLLSRLVRSRITDPTSGFRAFGPRAINLFAEEYPQSYPEPECLVLAHRHGLKIVEIPVVMKARTGGDSSIGLLTGLHYMFTVIINVFLRYLGTAEKRKDALC